MLITKEKIELMRKEISHSIQEMNLINAMWIEVALDIGVGISLDILSVLVDIRDKTKEE